MSASHDTAETISQAVDSITMAVLMVYCLRGVVGYRNAPGEPGTWTGHGQVRVQLMSHPVVHLFPGNLWNNG